MSVGLGSVFQWGLLLTEFSRNAVEINGLKNGMSFHNASRTMSKSSTLALV